MDIPASEWLDCETLPIVSEIWARLGKCSVSCRLGPSAPSRSFWVKACHEPSRRPEQGWKIHISAGVLTAKSALYRALPLILDEDVDFKIVASVRKLAVLNDGRGGLSQVGKFITVYPNDDAQAVRLACALDKITQGLKGPAVPSDRALRPQSLVHYRYGGFGLLQVRSQLGEILPAIRTPDGTLVPDRRLGTYYVPPWVEDPFVAAGVAGELPAKSRMIGSRHVIVAVLHHSPRSNVYLCLDVSGPKKCVIKRVTEDGNASLQRLRHEAEVLTHFAFDSRFPTPIELFEDSGGLCLAMEDIDGQAIERILVSLRERNMLPKLEDIVRWGCTLADILETIHASGLVYRDLKASNVVVTPEGQLRVVDFELARDRDGAPIQDDFLFGRGTRGYISPQQVAGHPPTVADDVYSLGALLYLIATGAEPSYAPDPSNLLGRPIELLNPALGPTLTEAIGRCLDPDPDRRFASPADLASTLLEARKIDAQEPLVVRGEEQAESETVARERSLSLARGIGDMLCDGVKESPGMQAFAWTLGGPFDDERWPTDLNAGAAGAILALAELVAEFDDPAHRAVLSHGARQLTDVPRPAGARLPGLYVGEAGIATAQLRAGQVLGDADLISTAAARGRWIGSIPHSSPDLFNGTAGRLRFHLWLWRETADQEHLDHAIAAAEHLLAVAGYGMDVVNWTIPPGYDSLSGRQLTGYAHGAAGIGDVLLDLFEVTGNGALLDAAVGVGRWLERLAQPALENDMGVNWPSDEQSRPTMAFWCHGAAGIARFLLHLGDICAMPRAVDLAVRAALVVARGTRWSGVTQCHGLAGNIECLLDVYQATDEEVYIREARAMARLMRAFALEQDGRLSLMTDLDRSSPGFSIGCAGVAACLLRLADPRTRPHLLTLAGFASRRD